MHVSSGAISTCVIKADKTIDCWGQHIPIPPDNLVDEEGEVHVYEQISLGSDHT